MRSFILAVFIVLFSFGNSSADPFPSGFEAHSFNGKSKPVTVEGVTTFTIFNKDCSPVDYGDGRGESDCNNGNVRTTLHHRGDANLGDALEYRFDVWIDPALSHEGFFAWESQGYEPDGWSSHLRVASWEGNYLHNWLYILKVSTRNGLTFLGRQCQAPSEFGTWVSFSMKVLWAGDDSGWIKVTCNDKVIYAAENVATNQAPNCFVQDQCEPTIHKDTDKIGFQVGAMLAGWGRIYKEQGRPDLFDFIPPEGITTKVRNLEVVGGAEFLSGSDKETLTALQSRLTELGCKVEPTGVPDRATHDAALSCRLFPDSVLPAEFGAATWSTFLAAYQGSSASALPAGRLPTPLPKPRHAVHLIENAVREEVTADLIITDFWGGVEGAKKDGILLSFTFVAGVDHNTGTYSNFVIIPEGELKKKNSAALQKCKMRLEVSPTGQKYAAARFNIVGEGLVYDDSHDDCIRKALPKEMVAQYEFVTSNFREMALAMLRSGTINGVKDDLLKTWLTKVARGEIAVRKSSQVVLPPGVLEPEYEVHAKEGFVQKVGRQVEVNSSFSVTVIPKDGKRKDFDFSIHGRYNYPKETFSSFSIVIEPGVKPNKALSDCVGGTMDYRDEYAHPTLTFKSTGADLVATNAECVIAALKGNDAYAATFLVEHFRDIAIGMVLDTTLERIKHDGVRTFMMKVAKGEANVLRQ